MKVSLIFFLNPHLKPIKYGLLPFGEFQGLKQHKFPDVIRTDRQKTDYYNPLIGRDSEDNGRN